MRITPAASALICLLTMCGSSASAEPRIQSERFDDWFYRCVDAAEGNEQKRSSCEVVQIAQTKQGEETINLLTVSLSESIQDKQKNTALTVLAPLNVFLPAGLDLSVDQGKNVTLQYRNCNNAGCWVQHLVDNEMLSALKSGQSGVAKLRLINGQNLSVKFSLKGLSPALKSLQDGKQPKEKS
jgi:invasion protein IalB